MGRAGYQTSAPACGPNFAIQAKATVRRNGSGDLHRTMPMIRPSRLTTYAFQCGNHESFTIIPSLLHLQYKAGRVPA